MHTYVWTSPIDVLVTMSSHISRTRINWHYDAPYNLRPLVSMSKPCIGCTHRNSRKPATQNEGKDKYEYEYIYNGQMLPWRTKFLRDKTVGMALIRSIRRGEEYEPALQDIRTGSKSRNIEINTVQAGAALSIHEQESITTIGNS